MTLNETRPDDAKLPRSAVSWLIRAAIAMVVLSLVVRLTWGWWIDRAMKMQLDAIRNRGQPVVVADIKYTDVPPEEDAWPLIVQAFNALSSSVYSPSNSSLSYQRYPPFPIEWTNMASASERANASALALMAQAARRQGANPPRVSSAFFPMLGDARGLTDVLVDDAVYAHLTGHDSDALERISDALKLAAAVRGQDSMVSQLTGLGIESMAYESAQIVAPGLARDAIQPASPQQIRQLIEQLLDEELIWSKVRESLLYDRCESLELANADAAGDWFVHPLATREMLRATEIATRFLPAADLRTEPALDRFFDKFAPGWREEMAARLTRTRSPTPPRPYSAWFRVSDSPNGLFPIYLQITIRHIAERRATAVSLAAQRYRMDHGHWPARLTELVPEYLPSVPADPYHDDGRPIGYVVLSNRFANHSARPMVYFDAGETTDLYISPAPMFGWHQDGRAGRKPRDIRQYRDLSRFAPPPPSTNALDNNQ